MLLGERVVAIGALENGRIMAAAPQRLDDPQARGHAADPVPLFEITVVVPTLNEVGQYRTFDRPAGRGFGWSSLAGHCCGR